MQEHFLLLSGLIVKEAQNSSRNTEHHYVTESTKWSVHTEFIIVVSEHLLYLKWENILNAVFSQKILHESRNDDRLISQWLFFSYITPIHSKGTTFIDDGLGQLQITAGSEILHQPRHNQH